MQSPADDFSRKEAPGPAPMPDPRAERGCMALAAVEPTAGAGPASPAGRGVLKAWYGWGIEIAALVVLAAILIWAMTLEPVQELDPATPHGPAASAPRP